MDRPGFVGWLVGAAIVGGLWLAYERGLRHSTWPVALRQAALVAGLWALFMGLAEYVWPGRR